jgi:hypothetical protein
MYGMMFFRGKYRVGGKTGDMGSNTWGGMDRWGGGENRWVRRQETIGQRINNTAVCSMLSPFDFKGRCFWGGRGGRTARGPLVETYFFTLRNAALRLL